MSSLQRYLIRFSYIGTKFRGFQIQTKSGDRDVKTVQGIIETGLQYLKPLNDPMVHGASRTDSGVHAIDNALHVDLMSRNNCNIPFEPEFITESLNSFLSKLGVDIRIKNTQKVSDQFNCRHHTSRRHYLYRLIIPKSTEDADLIKNEALSIPILENNRAWLVRDHVDVTKLKEGCELLNREADFASFMSQSGIVNNTVRNLQVDLNRANTTVDQSLERLYSLADVWNVHFSSSGFLYNQIRRCVGVLVGMASGKVSVSDVENMFSSPRINNYPNTVRMAPPEGLYLVKLEYSDIVLQPDFIPDDRYKVNPQYNFRNLIEDISPKILSDESNLEIKSSKPTDDLVKNLNIVTKECDKNIDNISENKREIYRQLHSLLLYRNIIDENINNVFDKLKKIDAEIYKISDEQFIENISKELELLRDEHQQKKMKRALAFRRVFYKKVIESYAKTVKPTDTLNK